MLNHQKYKALNQDQVRIDRLGDASIDSPFQDRVFDSYNRRILVSPFQFLNEENLDNISFEIAGAEPKIFFEPKKTKAAIVTCGGICPGLNNVIRALVLGLHYNYGVRKIFGVRFGLKGFIENATHEFVELNPEKVSTIHEMGGTILGSSRGHQNIQSIVDSLKENDFNIVFMVGGDGTLQAARLIQNEIQKRALNISIVGIPKTIDNDIAYVSHSFGFDSAVEVATEVIRSAHVEAKSAYNGIGLVKLMGRHSGFIAATAAVASRDVNFVIIPEVDLSLEGDNGFLEVLKGRIEKKQHAVIVVAEGAGQKYFPDADNVRDASGNLKLQDIGVFLKNKIKAFFKAEGIEINLKYLDPSYLVRSVPANTGDGLFCANLAQNAVHAAMAGKTNLVVSLWHGVYCYIPISLASSQRKSINDHGRLWQTVLESTGQPNSWN